ncbi:uncharacterized protein bod1l1 [Aplochiton taeniatus]
MAGLPPGDPQLVSMIVNHLKTQGLFDQFRRDCLADVDTKPAYLNLKQRVDNFVSNHLSNHTWSPHLNKNQLRNNIRQLVLQSGMLEQGVDRIVAQVVDPKINHTFRPQVERVVQEFLSPGSYVEEYVPALPPQEEEKTEAVLYEQASSSAPTTVAGGDAMSILDTITTLNQEATSRASSSGDKGRKGVLGELMQLEDGDQEISRAEEEDESKDDRTEVDSEETELISDIEALEVKTEDAPEQMDTSREVSTKGVKMEEEVLGSQEQAEDGKDKITSKTSVKSKDDDLVKSPNEKHQIKQKARERLKEEYSLEDSDLDGLSDITVSSVHTSDLSSFEEESDDEQPPSSSDDGQLSSDEEGSEQKQTSGDAEEDKERKPRRQAYVHKPFLYSRYYSDSDDEVTVEQRRRSAAKDKEERLLKRQQNRERMEEKRRLKAAQLEEQAERRKQNADSPSLEGPMAKEARKERKVLEKKMALNRKRKRDSRKDADVSSNKKGDGGEGSKKDVSGSIFLKVKDGKSSSAISSKPMRKRSESASNERRRRKSGSLSEDSNEPRKISEKTRTHSFILDLEQGAEELLKRPSGKFDRPARKELHTKDRREKERSLSEEHAKVKHKLEKRGEGHADESRQKDGADVKLSSEDRGEKKSKGKGDKKMSGTTREGRVSVSEGGSEEGPLKEATAKKGKGLSSETTKVEKEREKEKVREKEKDKERPKEKEREKIKSDKSSMKGDSKQLQCADLTGSSEERLDMEPMSDSIKKKDKQPREILKRSKSQTEDKPKLKPDSKDMEREKPKAEHGIHESQTSGKHSSDMEKDPRKSRETEKGKALEKSRSKSREELKAQSPKVDKTPPGLEVKSKAGAAISRSDTSKERKREGSAKERRGSEDIATEKSESKSAKKGAEKKKKGPEKKAKSQETAMGSKGEGEPDPSAMTSMSSPSLDTEEPPVKGHPLEDTSADSALPAAPTPTPVCDDTYDALSDITPEPEDGDIEVRLREVEPCALPAEADALLTLMDLCTSADARLGERMEPGRGVQGDSHGEVAPGIAIQDADIKMKEAALTLLSMDPDSKAPPALIPTDTPQEPEARPQTDPKEMETSAPEEHVQAVPESDPTTSSDDSLAMQGKPAMKRKRSEEPVDLNTKALDSDEPEQATMPQKEEIVSPSEDQAEEKEEGSSDSKTEEGEEDKETPQKKPLRKGRPSKGAMATTEDSDKTTDDKESDQKEEEEDGDNHDDEESSKAVTRTRAGSRLEAERNKPSKPSTRASRQNVKEEAPGGTRGTRGQAAAATKGGRKRDASPPVVRTRGGQKLEEPPSKRAKR